MSSLHPGSDEKQPEGYSSLSARKLMRTLFFVLVVLTSVVLAVLWHATPLFSKAAYRNIMSVIKDDSAVVMIDSNIQHILLVRQDGAGSSSLAVNDARLPQEGSAPLSSSSRPRPTITSTSPSPVTSKQSTSATTTASILLPTSHELSPLNRLMPTLTTPSTATTTTTTTTNSSLPSSAEQTPPNRLTSTTLIATSLSSISAPPTRPKVAVESYVSFHGGFADGRGLGNQMFDMAAVVYVAKLTNRKPAMLRFKYQTALEEVFELSIDRFDDLCPCYVFGEGESLKYDRRLEELANGSRTQEASGKSIFVWGFFQSWKYTRSVERELRRHFTFRPEIHQFAEDFLSMVTPPGWIAGYVRIGVHVRRGDVLRDDKKEFGYTTPDYGYFSRAMRHFLDKFDRIQFLVASNDLDWCRQNFVNVTLEFGQQRVNVTYLTGNSRGQDLALLASCEHVIMSTGTYGWWAAWLARGTTIYYSDWPKNGSVLEKQFDRKDFFPPTWVGMT